MLGMEVGTRVWSGAGCWGWAWLLLVPLSCERASAAGSSAGGDSGAGGSGSGAGSLNSGGTEMGATGGSSGNSAQAGVTGEASTGSGAADEGGTGQGGAGDGCAPSADAIPDDLRICITDQDCVAIERPTCGGCLPAAVNKEHDAEAAALDADFDAEACPAPDCQDQVCPSDPVVACETARCVMKTPCSERAEQSCSTDLKCHRYTAKLCSEGGNLHYLKCAPYADHACTDDSMCYLSPSGEPTLFPSSCGPPDYTPCPSLHCP